MCNEIKSSIQYEFILERASFFPLRIFLGIPCYLRIFFVENTFVISRKTLLFAKKYFANFDFTLTWQKFSRKGAKIAKIAKVSALKVVKLSWRRNKKVEFRKYRAVNRRGFRTCQNVVTAVR